jgi:hypothetical protein
MKIAICLYGKFTGRNLNGEIQGFETPYKYLKKNVLNSNTDIFIHGWNDDNKETSKLLKIIRPKKYIIEKQKKFRIKSLSKLFFSKNNKSREIINNHFFNNYSRFYSLKKAVSLVNKTYDIILISRFDCVFYKKINFNLFNPNNFYTSHWSFLHQDWGFNDVWFISGNKNMKNFSLIYDNLNKYYKPMSNFLRFLEKKNVKKEVLNAHAIWRYRIEELNLRDKLYAYGLEYLTYGLLRRVNKRYNPWGRPPVDINYPRKVPRKITKKFIHKPYTNINILNRLLYKIF